MNMAQKDNMDKYDELKFKEMTSRYTLNDKVLQFDVTENLKRLKIQSNGDVAFYFLAIISFIEGYLRNKYKEQNPGFDFDRYVENFGLQEKFIYIRKNLPSGRKPTRAERRTLNYIYNFMRLHGEYDKEESKKYLRIDGDRIRHCFCFQTENNLRALIGEFVKFSKIFDFYENNKDLIAELYSDDRFFGPLKRHEIEKELDIAEYNIHILLKEIQNTFGDEKLKLLRLLDEFQVELAQYVQTWRDYQLSITLLTNKQREISEEIRNKILKDKSIKKLIKGGPGTGKTLILINILQESLDKDIKLLTYTNSLTNYNKYLSNLISFNGKKLTDSDKKNVANRILGYDNYFISIAEKLFNKKIVPLNSVSGVQKICDKYNIEKEDLFEQAREIWLHLPEQKKYVDHTYSQPKSVDKEQQKIRQIFWDAVEDLDKVFELVETSFVPLEWVLYKIYKKTVRIPDALKCDYLLIDEIQDLEAAKIEAIKQMSRKGYVFAGDKTQSVFVRKGLPWGWLTKQELSTTKEGLTKNFRSTRPIQDLANAYRKTVNLKDSDAISKGFMPGPIPEGYISKKDSVVFEKLIERIKFMKDQLFFENGEFCIVAANDKLLDKIRMELSNQGYNSKSIEADDFDFEKDKDLIKLSKIKYVKGIDIPVIILVLDEAFLDRTGKENDGLDIYSQENSIYTCISRAMNILNVFFIDNGKMLIHSEDAKKNNAVLKLYETMKDSIVEL